MKIKDLIDFEQKIANKFNAGLIRSPVHLTYGNENFLIKFFKKIKENDWIFCSWRSHYHCLLKGVPPSILERAILKGRSISLCFPKYKIYSSAIVGGNLPIALGAALSIKKNKTKNRTGRNLKSKTQFENWILDNKIRFNIHDADPSGR
jgi:pyruvate dehydrogenase E1 component alpha subunit